MGGIWLGNEPVFWPLNTPELMILLNWYGSSSLAVCEAAARIFRWLMAAGFAAAWLRWRQN